MEIGTEFVASLTKWFPRRGIRKEAGPNSLQTMVDGIVSMTDTIATMETPVTNYLMFAKQQTGMYVALAARCNVHFRVKCVLNWSRQTRCRCRASQHMFTSTAL